MDYTFHLTIEAMPANPYYYHLSILGHTNYNKITVIC